MHSSACFLEYTESDTARLLENTDAQWLHGVACPVGGLHHREHGEAFKVAGIEGPVERFPEGISSSPAGIVNIAPLN
jgi:hypothetical protein